MDPDVVGHEGARQRLFAKAEVIVQIEEVRGDAGLWSAHVHNVDVEDKERALEFPHAVGNVPELFPPPLLSFLLASLP